ncbi:hypothetical protein LINPERHAP2_LOCUS2549 [Linum perenne]
MSRKIPQIWGKKGGVRISDVGWGFFVVKLESVEDYERAMFGGPWMVGDHYVVIQDWRPYFRPEDSTLSTLRVWVRLPGLPLEYFDYGILKRIGNKIGTTVRIDHTTLEGARGNFARICVEVDLSKPLLSKYRLRRRVRRIEYEGLHTICFGCGCYGHEEGACPAVATVEEAPPNSSSFSNPVFVGADMEEERPEVEEDFGPWMKVKRQPRRSQRQPPAAGRVADTSLTSEMGPASKPAQPSAATVAAAVEAPGGGKGKGKYNNSFQILEKLGEGVDRGIAHMVGLDSHQRTDTKEGNKENMEGLSFDPNQDLGIVGSGQHSERKEDKARVNQGPKSVTAKATSGPVKLKGDSQKNSVRVGSSASKPKETSKQGPRKIQPVVSRSGGDSSKTDQLPSKNPRPSVVSARVEGSVSPQPVGSQVSKDVNVEFVLVEDVTMEEALPSLSADRSAV